MSQLNKHITAALDAIARIESAPGQQPSERSFALAQLRNRISDAIVRLAAKAERKHAADRMEAR